MGVIIKDTVSPAVNAPRVRIIPPVTAGLTGWWDMSAGSAAERARNKASLAAPKTSIAYPNTFVSSDRFLSLGVGGFIDTKLLLATQFTMIVVARATATLDQMTGTGSETAPFRPTFISDYQAGTTTPGSFIWVGEPTLSLGRIQGRTTVSTSTLRTALIELDPRTSLQDWGVYILRRDATNLSLRNITKNVTASLALSGVATATGRFVRIGAAYPASGNPTGPCDIAQAAVYDSALSDNEISAVYVFLQTYLLELGITV